MRMPSSIYHLSTPLRCTRLICRIQSLIHALLKRKIEVWRNSSLIVRPASSASFIAGLVHITWPCVQPRPYVTTLRRFDHHSSTLSRNASHQTGQVNDVLPDSSTILDRQKLLPQRDQSISTAHNNGLDRD